MHTKNLSLLAVLVTFLLLSDSVLAQEKKLKQPQPISLAKIYKDIVNKRINDVPSSEGDEPLGVWQFGKNEKREIEILDEKIDDDTVTVTIKIYTQDDPAAQGKLSKLTGKLRLNYSRIAGGWSLDGIDNISMTYSPYAPEENESSSSENASMETQESSAPRYVNQPITSLVRSAFTVAPGMHRYFRFEVKGAAAAVEGRFRAQGGSGNDIKVYILDEDGYENFKNGHSVSTFYNSGQVTVGAINATLGSGVYYLVFDNGYSAISNKAVTAAIQLRPR